MDFDMRELPLAKRYKILSSTITPRPIAWVTSISAAGVINAAPFSFFNCVGVEPPLIVLGLDAWENWRLKARAVWMEDLKYPLMCFIAVAFWNMLGAGVFGFMINPPISLYYVQGLNTTPVHAHSALFGVYGFLALGFTLLVLRYVRPGYRPRPRLRR